jgi:hypothetical protein
MLAYSGLWNITDCVATAFGWTCECAVSGSDGLAWADNAAWAHSGGRAWTVWSLRWRLTGRHRLERIRPPAMPINDLVDLLHQADRLS